MSVVITVMSTYFSLESEFEDYLRQYNDEFEQTLKIEFQKVFHFIDKCGLPFASGESRIFHSDHRDLTNIELVEVGERMRNITAIVQTA